MHNRQIFCRHIKNRINEKVSNVKEKELFFPLWMKKKNPFCHTWTKNTHIIYVVLPVNPLPYFPHIRPISIYIRYQKSIMKEKKNIVRFASESDYVWFLLTIAKGYRLYVLIIFYLSRKWIRCNGKTIWISPFDMAHRRRKKKHVIRDGAIRWVYGLCNKKLY